MVNLLQSRKGKEIVFFSVSILCLDYRRFGVERGDKDAQ